MQTLREVAIRHQPGSDGTVDGCPLCGGINFTTKFVLPDPSYETVKCDRCGFVFMHPYPSDAFLDRFYSERELYGFGGDDAEQYERALEDRRRLVENLLSANSVRYRDGYAVDFGAGTGIMVAALSALGFAAIGLEKSPYAAAVGAKLFGATIVNKDLEEVEAGIRLFTLFDVLEHIKYPVRFLRNVHSRLADDACLMGSVPNYNGIGRYLHGTASKALVFPEHVNQFTRTTVARTLRDAGFEVLYIGFPPPYGVALSLGLRKGLLRRYGNHHFVKLAADALTLLKKYMAYPPLNLFVERTGVLGHSLVFVARKIRAVTVAGFPEHVASPVPSPRQGNTAVC